MRRRTYNVTYSFNIERPKDVQVTFRKLKERLEKYNGSLSGDNAKGSISSDGVEGTYIVKTDSVEITIHKKPSFIIPDFIVENEIRKIFREISSGLGKTMKGIFSIAFSEKKLIFFKHRH